MDYDNSSRGRASCVELPDNVYAAKFIPEEEWIVAGDDSGYIHVYNYVDHDRQQATSFKAHNGRVISLAVHPSDSYVLSTSDGDLAIKLWHWDQYWNFEKDWVCTKIFEGHSNKVPRAIFYLEDADSLVASVSWDGTVKVCYVKSGVSKKSIMMDKHPKSLLSVEYIGGADYDEHLITGSRDGATQETQVSELKPDVSKSITMDKHPDRLVCVDYITGAGGQHIITGSNDGTAQVWDLEKRNCIQMLQGHARPVTAVYWSPRFQKLITGSPDGTVRVWDSTTYSLENVIAFNLAEVYSFGYIVELQRIAVGCHQGIAIMETTFFTKARMQAKVTVDRS